MKLKQVKEYPLLSSVAVGEYAWVHVTDDDVRAMMKELEYCRTNRRGAYLAKQHHRMRLLGITEAVKDEDRRKMLDDLARVRTKESQVFLAETCHHLRDLGLIDKVEAGDAQRLHAALKGAAAVGYSVNLAPLYYYMRKLELVDRDSDVEKKVVVGLELARDFSPGRTIAQMHHLMGGVGLIEEVTDYDLKMIKNDLTEARKSGDGELITELLSDIQGIVPVGDLKSQQPMPPLKSFRIP
jgi:hypothetical protein